MRLTKRACGWPERQTCFSPKEAQREFDTVGTRGATLLSAWQRAMNRNRAAQAMLAGEPDLDERNIRAGAYATQEGSSNGRNSQGAQRT